MFGTCPRMTNNYEGRKTYLKYLKCSVTVWNGYGRFGDGFKLKNMCLRIRKRRCVGVGRFVSSGRVFFLVHMWNVYVESYFFLIIQLNNMKI